MDFLCAFFREMLSLDSHTKIVLFFSLRQRGAYLTSRPALAFITLHFVSLCAVIGIASSRWLGTQVVANLLRPQHFCAKLLYSGSFVLPRAFLQDASQSWTRPALVYVILTLADTRGISYLPALAGAQYSWRLLCPDPGWGLREGAPRRRR